MITPLAAGFWGLQPDQPEKGLYILGSLLVGVMLIVGLMFCPPRARKPLIGLVTFIAGLYFSLEFLVPGKGTADRILASSSTSAEIAKFFFGWMLRPLSASGLDADQNFLTPSVQGLATAWQVIAGFTFALGLWNLVHIHGKNILHTGRNWGFSIFFFIGVLVMSLAGFLNSFGPWKESPISAAWFRIVTEGMFFSLDASMFSLIAFFIISSAYRAFRIRSFDATLMMGAAFLVMLGQVPIGIWLTSWINPDGPLHHLRLEHISYWILTQPNAAAQRGINFGLAVGAMAVGLRIWLSLERGSYFEKEA